MKTIEDIIKNENKSTTIELPPNIARDIIQKNFLLQVKVYPNGQIFIGNVIPLGVPKKQEGKQKKPTKELETCSDIKTEEV
jgi:hypothetical protein